MTLLISTTFPVVIFLYMIYRKDHIKEPISLLLKCHFGGFLSILISLLISFPLSSTAPLFQGSLLSSFHSSFIEAAIPEEIAKFIILYYLIWKSKELDHHYDGIIYAVFVSLGFALIENIMYVMEGGLSVAIMRGILSVPGHGLFGVMMGYYFSLARFHEGESRKKYLSMALLIPIIFHGGYDFLLFYMSAQSQSPLILILILIGFAFFVIKLWREGLRKIRIHLQKDELMMIDQEEK